MVNEKLIKQKKELKEKQLQSEKDHIDSIKSFSGDKDQLRQLLNHYQNIDKTQLIKQVIKNNKSLSWLKNINDKLILQTYLAAKMLCHYGIQDEKLNSLIESEELSMRESLEKKKDKIEKSPIDIYHEKIKFYIGELEHHLDEFVDGIEFDFSEFITKHSLKPKTIKIIQNHFKKYHIDTIGDGEGYNKTTVKKLNKFYNVLGGELKKEKPTKQKKERAKKVVKQNNFTPCKQLWVIDSSNTISQYIAEDSQVIVLDRKTLKNVKTAIKKKPKSRYIQTTISKIKKLPEETLLTYMKNINSKPRPCGNRFIENDKDYRIIRVIYGG